MTGQQIADALAPQISGGTLRLDTQHDLGSARLAAALSAWFGGALTAGVGAPEIGPSSVVFTNAQLETAGFALYAKSSPLAVTLTFSSSDDAAIDLKTDAPMPAGYAWVDSFPSLATSAGPLTKTKPKSAAYALDSARNASAVATVTVAPAGTPLEPFAWLIGDAGLTATGALTLTTIAGTVYPVFMLLSPAAQTPNVGGFEVSAQVALRGGVSTSAQGTDPQGVTAVQLALAFVTPAFTIPLLVTLTGTEQKQFPVALDTSRTLPTVSKLAQLTDLALGVDPGSLISSDTPIGSLALRDLSATFDTQSKQISNAQISVGLGTDWTIIPGLPPLRNLTATLTVAYLTKLPPGTSLKDGVGFGVSAELGSTGLLAFVRYPEKIVGITLVPGKILDIATLINAFAPGTSVPGDLHEFGFYDLSAIANIGAGTYSLTANAGGTLAILPKFILENVTFAIEYGDGALRTVQFGAQFEIVGIDLYLSALRASDGWTLSTGLSAGKTVTLSTMVAGVNDVFDLGLPTALPDIEVTALELKDYTTKDGAFTFNAGITYNAGLDDPLLKKLSGSVKIAYSGKQTKKWSGTIAGEVDIGAQIFQAQWDFGESNVLSLSWHPEAGKSVGLLDFCELFGIPKPDIPEDLDVQLVEASAVYDVTAKRLTLHATSQRYGEGVIVIWRNEQQKWNVFFGVAVKHPIVLSDLPLIGEQLSKLATVSLEKIQAEITTATIDEKLAKQLAEWIKSGPKPPPGGMSGKFGLSMDFHAGSYTLPITVGEAPKKPQILTAADVVDREMVDGVILEGEVLPPEREELFAAGGDDGTVWFDLQKTFGPVSIQKIGVRYSGGLLWALMTASLKVGGLTITVIGLGAGSKLSTFSPKFTVQGLEIGFAQGPISIDGGLTGTIDPVDFTGQLVIKATELTIGAIGGYAQFQGHPSFFVYAMLGAPLGGPPYFFVTGVALGFGFNRRLMVPDVAGVATFPLVAWANDAKTAPPSNPLGDIKQQVNSVLDKLTSGGIVAPSVGDYWLAAGLKFTSFKILDAFALLTVQFGNHFEIALLGLGTVSVPPKAPTPVAQVQLALAASFSPDTGLLAIAGQLTPASYILSTNARLTGGFAFYLWFAGPHEGDFVVSIGGYSPRFKKPDHYPEVPRLGLNWRVTDQLSITGGLYFALTSSAVMAGGALSATWRSGGISAWFDVYADFLMTFLPFHYYISAGIDLGCSFTVDLWFTSFTVSVHVGVGIEIWGPEFAGRATIDLSLISFTIEFGASGQDTSTKVPWKDFVTKLLPPPQPKKATPRRMLAAMHEELGLTTAADPAPDAAVIHITFADGLLKALSETPGALNAIADPFKTVFTVQSVFPTKTLGFGSANLTLAPESEQPKHKDGTPIVPNTNFGVGPTGTPNDQLGSVLTVTITTGAKKFVNESDSTFHAVRVIGNAPKALWELKKFDSHGVPQNTDALNDTTIPDVLTGCRLVPWITQPHVERPIPIERLEFTNEENVRPFAWSGPVVPTADPFTDQTVAATIDAPLAQANRPMLLGAFARTGAPDAGDVAVDVSVLASPVRSYLLAEPVLCLLGEAKT